MAWKSRWGWPLSLLFRRVKPPSPPPPSVDPGCLQPPSLQRPTGAEWLARPGILLQIRDHAKSIHEQAGSGGSRSKSSYESTPVRLHMAHKATNIGPAWTPGGSVFLSPEGLTGWLGLGIGDSCPPADGRGATTRTRDQVCAHIGRRKSKEQQNNASCSSPSPVFSQHSCVIKKARSQDREEATMGPEGARYMWTGARGFFMIVCSGIMALHLLITSLRKRDTTRSAPPDAG